jgi:CheY-like chemotaxis protein
MSDPSSNQPARRGAKFGAVAGAGRTNSVGLSAVELEAVFRQLDSGVDASRRRESARMEFRKLSVGMEIMQPGGGQTQINVACRNLSRSGLGFLHSSYIHIGTPVALTLSHQNKQQVRVMATVVRCRHVQRHIHDVGVRFEKPINVRDFISMDPLSQTFTCERVDPEHLTGTLLLVAEYEVEQACVRTMLRGTAMDVVVASSIAQGLECARKGVSIIFCDDVFEKGTGADFVREARKTGLRCPIVLMSADHSGAAMERFRSAEADAFLAKPLDQDLLMRAIAEFLLAKGDRAENAGPVHTSLPADSPLRGIAEGFVKDLHDAATTIEALVRKSDLMAIRGQCLRLGGPANSLGYEPIATMAGALAETLDGAKTLDASILPLNTFIAACRSARLPPEKKVESEAAPAAPDAAKGHDAPAPPAKAETPHAKPADAGHATKAA